MPVQQTMSSFAKKLGARVAQANAEHAAAPVDTGNRRLPAGIRDGVARLATMYTKEQTEDGGMVPKGQVFFRASAVVVSPAEHNGERIAGLTTSKVIPLCDVPAKGQRKATSFSENWFEFQNLFKLLGIPPCPETAQTDPTGQRTEAYFFAAMQALTSPLRLKANPVYISFSTRGWTPPASAQQPNPTEMVFETWHGLANPPTAPDPASGVAAGEAPPQPSPTSAPPAPTTWSKEAPPPLPVPIPDDDLPDKIATLVEVAMNDPEGATEEGAAAAAELEDLAWRAGWSKEQTAGAADWVEVGEMALNEPEADAEPTPKLVEPAAAEPTVTVGSRWNFQKRTKEGAKLRNNKSEEFPPQEVEVVTVDEVAKTCTVRTVKDGKPVIDIKSKKPVDVRFDWLEPLPF